MPKSVQERRQVVEELAREFVTLGATLMVAAKQEENGAFETAELEDMFGTTLVSCEILTITAAQKCDCTARGVQAHAKSVMTEVLDNKRRAG